MVKNCPDGKILNPNTGRCVKKDGKIGKALLKASSRKVSKKSKRKVSKKSKRKVSKKSKRKVSKKASRKVSKKASKKVSKKNKKFTFKRVPIKEIFSKDLVEKELKILHPSLKLLKGAYNKIMAQIFPIYRKSIRLLREGKEVESLTDDFPEDIAKYSLQEANRAMEDVKNNKSLSKYLYGENWDKFYPKVSKEVNYGYAAFFEYILAEILETVGNFTIDEGKNKIDIMEVIHGLNVDKDIAYITIFN